MFESLQERQLLKLKYCTHDLVQDLGCMESSWARLAANVGDDNAIRIIEKEWREHLPEEAIEVNRLRKAGFSRMS